jgi:hypothetical protein
MNWEVFRNYYAWRRHMEELWKLVRKPVPAKASRRHMEEVWDLVRKPSTYPAPKAL